MKETWSSQQCRPEKYNAINVMNLTYVSYSFVICHADCVYVHIILGSCTSLYHHRSEASMPENMSTTNADQVVSGSERSRILDAHRNTITHEVNASSDHARSLLAPCNRGFHLSLERQVSPQCLNSRAHGPSIWRSACPHCLRPR